MKPCQWLIGQYWIKGGKVAKVLRWLILSYIYINTSRVIAVIADRKWKIPCIYRWITVINARLEESCFITVIIGPTLLSLYDICSCDVNSFCLVGVRTKVWPLAKRLFTNLRVLDDHEILFLVITIVENHIFGASGGQVNWRII